jgi:hypothetical protein
MAAFDRTVELAKRQLPRAFTIGGGLPYSGGGDPRRLPERLDNLEEGAFANAVGSTIPAGTEEAGTEDVRNLEGSFTESFGELGFEAIAFYVSFHKPTPDGLWGIFYFDHRVRQFTEIVRREFHLPMQNHCSCGGSKVRPPTQARVPTLGWQNAVRVSQSKGEGCFVK